MTGSIAVVVTGHEDADLAARAWAHWRGRYDGREQVSVLAVDAGGDGIGLAVVGRRTGEHAATDADRIIDLATRLPTPLVVVAAGAPARPASELADRSVLPVVVGVPTDTGAGAVLDVAAAEAVAIRTDLVVERIWRESDWLTCMTRAEVDELKRSRGRDGDRLDAAVLHVHHHHPDLDVRAELRDGNVHTWLTGLSHRASAVVMGTGADGRGELAHWAVTHVEAPLVLVPTASVVGGDVRDGGRFAFDEPELDPPVLDRPRR